MEGGTSFLLRDKVRATARPMTAALSLAQSADKKAMSGAKASESYVPQPNW